MKQEIVIFTAFKEEYQLLKDLLGTTALDLRDTCTGHKWIEMNYHNHEVTLVQTGQGPFRASSACKTFLKSPDLVLCFGFCGALHEKVKIGDVCISQKLKRYSLDNKILMNETIDLDSSKVKETNGLKYWKSLLTVERPIGTPILRKKLYDESNCDCVDMEAFEIAKFCHAHNISCFTLKVVMDEIDHIISQPIQKIEMEVLMKNLEMAKAKLNFCVEKVLDQLRKLN